MQFISRNPSFRCGRLAKCWECVHVGSTICCITILGTLYFAACVSKNTGIRLFDSSQTISVCSRDGAMAKSSQNLGVEMPPRVVELWNFFQRCVPHKCLLSAHRVVPCPLGVSPYMHSGYESMSKSVNHVDRFVFLEPARLLIAVTSRYPLKDESC